MISLKIFDYEIFDYMFYQKVKMTLIPLVLTHCLAGELAIEMTLIDVNIIFYQYTFNIQYNGPHLSYFMYYNSNFIINININSHWCNMNVYNFSSI